MITSNNYRPQPSIVLNSLLWLFHVMSFWVVCFTHVSILIVISLSFFLVCSLYFHLLPSNRSKLFNLKTVDFFSLFGEDVTVFSKNGEMPWFAKILPQTLVTSYFILLCVQRESQQIRYQLIFWDSLTEEEFRQLSVVLKFIE